MNISTQQDSAFDYPYEWDQDKYKDREVLSMKQQVEVVTETPGCEHLSLSIIE